MNPTKEGRNIRIWWIEIGKEASWKPNSQTVPINEDNVLLRISLGSHQRNFPRNFHEID